MGPIGVPEMIFIFVMALLIFGPKKLPELGRSFGKGMAEFKRASNELKSTFQREMDNIDSETREVKDTASSFRRDINKSYYDDTEDDYYSDYDSPSGSKSSSSKSVGSSSTESSSSQPTTAESTEKEAVNGSPAVAGAHNGAASEHSDTKSGSST